MAERRTLGDAMTPEKIAFIRGSTGKQSKASQVEERPQAQARTIELSEPPESEETQASPRRRRSRGQARQAQPNAGEILDSVLESRTIRLRRRTNQALTRASLERELASVMPYAVQDIAEDAISDWLAQNGYLD
jgi:hypothetical protein